jgi:hypothetical protein
MPGINLIRLDPRIRRVGSGGGDTGVDRLVEAAGITIFPVGVTGLEGSHRWKVLKNSKNRKDSKRLGWLGYLGVGVYRGTSSWRRSSELTSVDTPFFIFR